MCKLHLLGVFFMTCWLPLGCANWPAGKLPDADAQLQRESMTERRVATDFVSALQQIPSMSPTSTTIQLLQSAHDDLFTRQMQDALRRAGYGIRWVGDGVHGQLFQFRHELQRDPVTQQLQTLYEIAFGSVEMRRRYTLDAQRRVMPATPMYVRGADASGIRLDDSHFAQAGTVSPVDEPVSNELAVRQSVGSTSRQASAGKSGSRQSLTVAREVNPLDPLISGADSKQSLSLPLIALPRVQNVFELGGSNYKDLLAGHRVVREQVLTFANDSLRLGAINKHLLEQMVESFRPESDVFSVLGCSLGPTQLKSGNAALALGRASRVREALLFAGVPQDRILDEGCWAGDGSGQSLPRRGVVVTLNRSV